MIVSINQPAYMPWLGYFDRIAKSDLHVTLDTVQFEKNSFTNRNRLRTQQGSTWITVPVRTKGRFGDLVIRDVEVSDDRDWRRRHQATMEHNYRKARFFSPHHEFISDVLSRPWTQLGDLLAETTRYMIDQLRIERR